MTNEEINALTDQQINLMMALNDESHQWTMDPNNKERHVGEDKDYCNDPAVMMPIVFANGISLIKTEIGEGWTACFAESWNGGWDLSFASNAFCEHTNPLRAAAIVYLKMNGVL